MPGPATPGSGPATREKLYELHRAVGGSLLAYFKDRPTDKLRASMVLCAISYLRLCGIGSNPLPDEIAETLERAMNQPFPFSPDGQQEGNPNPMTEGPVLPGKGPASSGEDGEGDF